MSQRDYYLDCPFVVTDHSEARDEDEEGRERGEGIGERSGERGEGIGDRG